MGKWLENLKSGTKERPPEYPWNPWFCQCRPPTGFEPVLSAWKAFSAKNSDVISMCWIFQDATIKACFAPYMHPFSMFSRVNDDWNFTLTNNQVNAIPTQHQHWSLVGFILTCVMSKNKAYSNILTSIFCSLWNPYSGYLDAVEFNINKLGNFHIGHCDCFEVVPA